MTYRSERRTLAFGNFGPGAFGLAAALLVALPAVKGLQRFGITH